MPISVTFQLENLRISKPDTHKFNNERKGNLVNKISHRRGALGFKRGFILRLFIDDIKVPFAENNCLGWPPLSDTLES